MLRNAVLSAAQSTDMHVLITLSPCPGDDTMSAVLVAVVECVHFVSLLTWE